MSTADISDEDFIAAIRANEQGPAGWAMVWDVAATLGVSENEARKKFRRVYKRGLVDGCNCGCRGDWTTDVSYRRRRTEA